MSMSKEELLKKARNLINRPENKDLRIILFELYSEFFKRMMVNQFIKNEIEYLSPVDSFNYGLAAGRYSFLSEILTGLKFEELENTDDSIMEEFDEEDDELLSQKEKEYLLNVSLERFENIVCKLYELFEDVKKLEDLATSSSGRKSLQSNINKIIDERDNIISKEMIDLIKQKQKSLQMKKKVLENNFKAKNPSILETLFDDGFEEESINFQNIFGPSSEMIGNKIKIIKIQLDPEEEGILSTSEKIMKFIDELENNTDKDNLE